MSRLPVAMGPGDPAVYLISTPCCGGFRSSKRSSSGTVSVSRTTNRSSVVGRIEYGEKLCTLTTLYSAYSKAPGQAGSQVVGNMTVTRKC